VAFPNFNEDSALQKPLEHFRAKTKRLKIHPLELLLLWIVGVHLVFLPWAIGGMRLWGQLVSITLALASLGVALIPRHYTEEHTGAGGFRLVTWPKLVRFPIFWIGLLLFGYIALQGSNPAWIYRDDGKGWWMEAIPYIEWLPTSVSVPFDHGGGPWRVMIVYASAWLMGCAIWVGFTRRRTLQALFIAVSANGIALAGFGLIQRMLSNGKLFWFWESPNSSFFSSFVYKNQAGAYLNLTLAVTCGLGTWYYLRGLRRLEKSNPAGLFAFFATCIAVAILVSYARGATLIMLLFLCGCAVAFTVKHLRAPNAARRPVVGIALLLIFCFFLKTGFDALNSREAWTRLSNGLNGQDTSLESRRTATQAAIEMWGNSWRWGVGAGCFRFLFPVYQQHYPSILTLDGKADGPHAYWEHAHNDLVETSLELGVPGLALVLAAGCFLSVRLIRIQFWGNPLGGCATFGNILLIVYARWDFPLQCPAVLVLWVALSVATLSWTQFEEMNPKG